MTSLHPDDLSRGPIDAVLEAAEHRVASARHDVQRAEYELTERQSYLHHAEKLLAYWQQISSVAHLVELDALRAPPSP